MRVQGTVFALQRLLPLAQAVWLTRTKQAAHARRCSRSAARCCTWLRRRGCRAAAEALRAHAGRQATTAAAESGRTCKQQPRRLALALCLHERLQLAALGLDVGKARPTLQVHLRKATNNRRDASCRAFARKRARFQPRSPRRTDVIRLIKSVFCFQLGRVSGWSQAMVCYASLHPVRRDQRTDSTSRTPDRGTRACAAGRTMAKTRTRPRSECKRR